MDATNNKTLTGFLVTLLVGATFVAAISPTAEATHLGTGGIDVQIEVRSDLNPAQTVTIYNGTNISYASVLVPTSPLAYHLKHATSYELTFVGIDVRSGSGYGYTSGSTANVEIVNVSSGAVAVAGTPLTTGPDGPGTCTGSVAPGCQKNATFIITTSGFTGPGEYRLRTSDTQAEIAIFVVYPAEDISVAVTSNPPTLTYTGNQAVINVATGVGATTLSSLAAGFITTNPVTDASGNYAFVSTLPMGTGVWPIYAGLNTNSPTTTGTAASGSQCIFGTTNCNANFACTDVPCQSVPERMGNTTLTVNANTLTVTPASTSAFVGFQNTVTADVKWPTTGNTVFGGTPDATIARWNLTVGTPSAFYYISNGTGSLPATLTGAANFTTSGGPAAGWTCQSSAMRAAGTVPAACAGTVPNLGVDATTHRMTFQNLTWESGTYTVWIQFEVTGGTTSAPEYLGTWQVSATAPAAVNLEATPTTVDVPAPTGTIPTTTATPSSAQGTVTATVTISGDTVFRHPLCDRSTVGVLCSTTWETDTQFADNVSLRGAVLAGWNVTSYDSATGIVSLRFTPSANGTIWADVAWKNTTTTIAIPVIRGANITLDRTNITVDATTTVTATVKDAFGNVVSNAKVWAIPRTQIVATSPTPLTAGSYSGTGAAVVLGTGGAGAGQGGMYTFNLRPDVVQNLVIVAEIGSTGNLNYTYAPLTVLPNLDLAVTLNTTRTMAALRTQFVANVTNTSGNGQTGTDANFQWYFLTPTQVTNLQANGTTGLFTGATILATGDCVGLLSATTLCRGPTTGSSANGTVTNLTLNSGDYRVYFCSSTTSITDCRTAIRDNRNNMPLVNVTAYNAVFNPPQIANNPDIQGATVVNVRVTDWNGTLTSGTISFRTNGTLTTSGSTLSATVTNGQANITLTGANTGIGNVEWNFNPLEATGSDAAATDRVLGVLEVVAGNLTFQPSKVPILQSTLITSRLTNFAGVGLPGRVIRLCSSSLNSNWPTTPATNANPPTTLAGTDITNCPAVASTEPDGTSGIVVTPTSLNAIHVYVNNSYTGRTISVTAGTLTVTVNPIAPTAGQNVTLTATQPGGTPSSGSRILVTRDGTTVLDATADGNGQAALPGTSVTAGSYVVTAIRSGFDNGTATFTVGAAPNTTAAVFNLSNLVLPSTINVGSPITVSVDVKNTGTAAGTANAILLVNNAQRDTQSVTLDAGANTTVAYTFTPTVGGTYSVSVRIGTTTIGPQTITVGTPTTTTPATGTVPVTSTPPTGVTATPPTGVTATPPTSATTATPATTTPKVPGFEVVALLAALAVAMLVLRRRN